MSSNSIYANVVINVEGLDDTENNHDFDIMEYLGDAEGFKQAIVDHWDLPMTTTDEDGEEEELDIDDIILEQVIDFDCDNGEITDMEDAESFLETGFEDEGQALLFLEWCDVAGASIGDFSDFENNMLGEYESSEDFAKEYMNSNGELDDLHDYVLANIDWSGVWDDLETEHHEVSSPTGYSVFIFTA